MCPAHPASAHPFGQRPVLLVTVAGATVSTDWIIARDEARILSDRFGAPPETLPSRARFVSYMRRGLTVDTTGPCRASVRGVARVASGYRVALTHACDEPVARARITVRLLHDLSRDYVTLYRISTPAGPLRGALTASAPSIEVNLRAPASLQPTPSVSPVASPRTRSERITAALQEQTGAPALAAALLLALLLGALHGLTPGHGKTITAAYLVGARGTIGHAVALAGIVTVAHTASMLALTIAAVALDRLFLPAQAAPWLQVATGLLIIGVGVTLVRARPHAHAQEQTAPPLARLALIGLIGGLVPSPEALGVLLVAFTIGKWAAGVGLAIAFSLGLAVVVLGVAVAAVVAGERLERMSHGRWGTRAPRIAAAIFVLMGVVVAVGGALRL